MHTKNSAPKQILRYVAIAGGVAVLSLAAPLLPLQLARAYVRHKRFERKKFLRDLRRLQERELVDAHEAPDGTIQLTLRKKGKEVMHQFHFETMAVARPKRWDGMWRLVVFDIPRAKNKARDAIRQKLRALGFYQLQESIFLHPFPCEKEIDALAVFFGVRNHVLLLNVSGFEGEEKLRHHFKI